MAIGHKGFEVKVVTQGGFDMLVLSRKMNEEIVIADSIRVKILGISGNRVRLGISAPDQVPVVREELHAQMMGRASREMTLELVASLD